MASCLLRGEEGYNDFLATFVYFCPLLVATFSLAR